MNLIGLDGEINREIIKVHGAGLLVGAVGDHALEQSHIQTELVGIAVIAYTENGNHL